MINRRTALGIIASASTIGAYGATLAKEKHGKVDVFAEVNNGKVVGVSAAGMQVKKVKSRQKLAETPPGLMLASMQLAQTDVYYYGYWVYDPVADYYYWFTADVVIVDASWVDYVP